MMNVGLLYNLRRDYVAAPGMPPDGAWDWDDRETIDEIADGLRRNGLDVLDIGDPRGLLDPSLRDRIDVVFSICEMTGLRHREAQVPALCELLGIPYGFSPPEVMICTLDKNLANLIARQAAIPVPPWSLVTGARDLERFTEHVGSTRPLIVKPVAEGSSIGVDSGAVVRSRAALVARVAHVLRSYRQPAVVQHYCPGRELTVGVIEQRGVATAMSAMEIHDAEGRPFGVYGGPEKETPGVARLTGLPSSDHLGEQARELALRCHLAFGCRDASRIDLREDEHGGLCFLECNPLPHLHPVVSDFCHSARAAGYGYEVLLAAVVNGALRRARHVTASDSTTARG